MKRVLVTGGSKGIGLEIVKEFLAKKCVVYVLARNSSSIPGDILDKVHFISFDLNNVTKIEDIVKETGGIDVLVNNAAVLNSLPYDDYDHEKRNNLINVNMVAPVELITQYSERMIQGPGLQHSLQLP